MKLLLLKYLYEYVKLEVKTLNWILLISKYNATT